MMTRSQIPFSDILRAADPSGLTMPQFQVCRRPMVVQGQELKIGDRLPIELFKDRVRIRQLYDSRLIEPVEPPAGSVRSVQSVRAAQAAAEVGIPPDVPASPAVPLPAVVSASIPVAESDDADTGPSAYTPPNKRTKRRQ
jgi:hypothetical protein